MYLKCIFRLYFTHLERIPAAPPLQFSLVASSWSRASGHARAQPASPTLSTGDLLDRSTHSLRLLAPKPNGHEKCLVGENFPVAFLCRTSASHPHLTEVSGLCVYRKKKLNRRYLTAGLTPDLAHMVLQHLNLEDLCLDRRSLSP